MCSRSTAIEPAAVPPAAGGAAERRRNQLLGVLSGTCGQLAHSFMHPELVLAGMMERLTGSNFLVALIAVTHKVGAFAPQLWVGSRLEHHPRKRPFFIAATVIRAVATLAMIGALVLFCRHGNGLALGLFFLAYLAMCMCGGTGHVIFMDMAGRAIPTERVGRFFGLRNFVGGSLAVAAGIFIIQPFVENEGLVPVNYLILAIIGGVLAITDMTLWGLSRENAGPSAKRRGSLRESIGRGFRWLRADRNYRAYLWLRIAFRINYLGLAFFIPYGSQAFKQLGPGGAAAWSGILVATMRLARVITSIIWGRLADRHGYRSPLLASAVLFLLSPILALLAPALPQVFRLPLPGLSGALDLPLVTYLAALALLGAAMQGGIIGGSRFLIRSAPPHRRISYVGFMNTITMPLALLPLVGAWVANTYGMSTLFAAITGGGVLSVAGALYMRPEDTANGQGGPQEAGLEADTTAPQEAQDNGGSR